jgi:hypothetical protein
LDVAIFETPHISSYPSLSFVSLSDSCKVSLSFCRMLPWSPSWRSRASKWRIDDRCCALLSCFSSVGTTSCGAAAIARFENRWWEHKTSWILISFC